MAAFDISVLLKFSNSNLLAPFLHNCVDELMGRKKVSFDNYSSDIEWTKQDCENARNAVLNLYKTCVLADEALGSNLSYLPPSLQDVIRECYSIRKEHILQAVLEENLVRTGQPVVENIDWRLKWVLGSSKLVTISEPLLNVDLHCLQNADSYSRSCVSFEMNMEQTNALIAELERVKAMLSEKS